MKAMIRFNSILICLSLLLLIFTNGSFAQADSLTNIGHASMKIKTVDDKVIYIDPYAPGDYSDSADIILVTHAHQDHSNTSLVPQKTGCIVITHAESNLNGVYQTFYIDDITVSSVPAYNQNHQITQCVGYIVEFNGIRLYHAGDTGNIPEMANLADSNITYALLPVDNVFTMSPEEATEAANAIQADFSIPMHTEPPPDDYNEENVARFTPSNRLLVRNGETIALTSASTNAEEKQSPSMNFHLYQNYPNPFNPSTTFRFSLSKSSLVTLKIFDLNGNEVGTILSEEFSAGNYSKDWFAKNLSSGVYFYQLKAEGFSDIKKLVLLK